jgi:hypothetical protein
MAKILEQNKKVIGLHFDGNAGAYVDTKGKFLDLSQRVRLFERFKQR